MFSRPTAAPIPLPVPIDWSSCPIEPAAKWAARAMVPPDGKTLARRAVQRSGRNASDIDLGKVVLGLQAVFEARAVQLLENRGVLHAKDDLAAIFRRADFVQRMPWDYLTTLGTTGITVHNELGSYLASDDLLETVAASVRSGLTDVDTTGE